MVKMEEKLTEDKVIKKHHITNPQFWVDENGNHPISTTMITVDDVEARKWVPTNKNISVESVLKYLKSLSEVQDEIPLSYDDYTRVAVALTCSGLINFEGGIDEGIETLIRLNIPICSVKAHVALFGTKELSELKLAKIVMELAEKVHIDVDKRYVEISGPKCSYGNMNLVEYTEIEDSDFSRMFFNRWSEIHELMLEFTVINFEGENSFTIRGLWKEDRWLFKDMFIFPVFNIILKK